MLKRKLALVLAAVIVITAFAGCGKKEETAVGDTFETAPVVYFARSNTFESAIGKTGDDYNDNDYTRYIYEKTGVRVQPVMLSSNTKDMTQQLATKRAGGEQIDLICYGDLAQSWMQSKLIIPINDIFKEYGDQIVGWNPYDKENCRIYDSGWEPAKKIDTYWGVPGRSVMDSNGSKWYYIRRDWLDKVGLDMPQTSADLGKILRAFTEQDPDGNGQNDTWGMSHNGSSLVNELLLTLGVESWREYIVNDKGEIDENGKNLISQSMHPHARKQYAQIREWCQKGWINEAGITDETANDKLITNNKVGVVLASYSEVVKWQKTLLENGFTNAQFEFCTPHMVNVDDGKFYGFPTPYNMGTITMFTSMAKKENYPNIIKLLNWMYSDEGTIFQSYGIEGKEYKRVNGEIVVDRDYLKNKTYKAMFMFGRAYDLTFPEEIERVYGTDKLARDYVRSVMEDDYTVPRTDIKFDYPDLPEFTTYPDWRKGVEQYLLLFTVGDKDPMNDKDWNEYIKLCDSYGIQKLMDAAAKVHFKK